MLSCQVPVPFRRYYLQITCHIALLAIILNLERDFKRYSVSAHPLPKNAGFLRPPFFLDHDVFLDLMLSWQEEFPTPSCFFAMEEIQGGLLMPPLSATLITVIRSVRLHKGMAHKKWPNLVGSDHTCSGARRRVGGYHASQQ